MSAYITIFTPTYNRTKLLSRLYSSLVDLDYDLFEWVIIDDGSTDDTAKIISQFIKEKKISIVYKKQKKLGKHVAINEGVKLAKGELFFILDSDDWLPKNSLKLINEKYISIKNLVEIIGVVGKRYVLNEDKSNVQLQEREFINILSYLSLGKNSNMKEIWQRLLKRQR